MAPFDSYCSGGAMPYAGPVDGRATGGTIFPQTFRTVLVVVGVIWIVQGLGILDTGSFMDRRPVWAVAGAMMVIAGAVSTLVHRRKARGKDVDQPDS